MARRNPHKKRMYREDRTMWAMDSERLQEHLKLRARAGRLPDKKKENAKKACRNTRQAFGPKKGPFVWSNHCGRDAPTRYPVPEWPGPR